MKTFGEQAFNFLKGLTPDFKVPDGVECLLPFNNEEVRKINQEFFTKYYSDQSNRKMIIGINPGRFGAGLTGVNFTDPIKLKTVLGIENSFVARAELSSDFIYKVIDNYGGAQKFYRDFYITSVSPIGFTRSGKNLNYYDDKALQNSVMDFIERCMEKQLKFGIDRRQIFCLGEGSNFKFLEKLNAEKQWFEQVIPLAHPRFVMQYKRKSLENYVEAYLKALKGT
jgi:hypothetical protein